MTLFRDRMEGTVNKIIGGLLLWLAMSIPAFAFENGDWVLGHWQGGGYWYPGVVEGSNQRSVTIQYDDGDRETVPPNRVKSYDWRVGSRVECNWQNGGKWYPGVISQLDKETLGINYDDGDTEVTKTAACRSR
jgi:hypothetical protein